MKTFNCTALTGGGSRALDAISISDLTAGDRALCAVSGQFLYFEFDSTLTDAEGTASHPFKVRPDDYSTGGVWVEQQTDDYPIPSGSAAGDIIRWNSTTLAWEAKSEPFSFTEIVLTPATVASTDVEGGLWYNSADDAVYVCADT